MTLKYIYHYTIIDLETSEIYAKKYIERGHIDI